MCVVYYMNNEYYSEALNCKRETPKTVRINSRWITGKQSVLVT